MLSVIVSGLAIGALYGATALAYNLMYSTSKVLSVTTGHICMLGSVFGAWFIAGLGLPAPIGLLGAVLVGALFGLVTDVVAVRRVLARSEEHLWLLSTLAVATMVQQAVGLWWGTEPRPFPRLIPQDFTAGILDQKFWLPIAFVLLAAAALELFYRRTLWGKLFLATSEDAFAARARGIATDRVRAFSYLLAGTLGGLAGLAVCGVALAALPYWINDLYQLHLAALIGIYWVLIAGLNLVVGFAGQLSIGHVGLLAIGAYCFAILAGKLGFLPELTLAAAGGLGALCGFLFGLPSLRLPGFYFAMATLAFSLIVSELSLAQGDLTSGGIGLSVPGFSPPFDTPRGLYWLALILAAAVTWATW